MMQQCKPEGLILEKAGHTISQARDLRQVKEVCQVNSFSIVIFGSSVEC
jgi:hypothetical protein